MSGLKITSKTLSLIFVIASAALYFALSSDRNSFPDIPAGAYVGTVTGFGINSDDPSNFYLERMPESNLFIAVIFSEGFRPQAVTGAELSEGRFEPLAIFRGETRAEFVGGGKGGSYSGKIRFGEERTGRWSIQAVPTDQLVGVSYNDDFPSWIEQKARLRIAKREHRVIDQKTGENSEKREKLKTFLQNETLLKERAKLKRDTLAAELDAGLQERKRNRAAIGELVGQLELVGRISKTGQAVALARRISNRENQWYLANWGAEAESEVPVEESGIDPAKLDSELRSAEEVRALLRQIEVEQKKIKELEQELDTQIQVVEPSSQEENVPKPSSLWEKLFQ